MTESESKLAIIQQQDSNLVALKYNQLNYKLQKVYNLKKAKTAEIESLKNAFKEFIDLL